MKKLSFIVAIAGAALLLSSCGAVTVDKKDIKHMDIRFRPLERSDFTLVGNLENTTTIAVGQNLLKDYKKGLITSRDVHEVMYFAPGPNQTITGTMYENALFNNVYGPGAVKIGGGGLFGGLFKGLSNAVKGAMPPDPGMDFAYFEMVKKYPNIDYFINVRFDRKTVVSGGKSVETITVKADGIQLRTDN